MNDVHESSLEDQLRQATVWSDAAPTPELWRRALESSSTKRLRPSLAKMILSWSLPKAMAAAIGIVLIGAVVTALMVRITQRPSDIVNGYALAVQPPDARNWNDRQVTFVDDSVTGYNAGMMDQNGDRFTEGEVGGGGGGMGGGGGRKLRSSPDANLYSLARGSPFSNASQPTADGDARSVIQKATIELITSDVRAALLKATHLVSQASGEYVQDSNLTGEGKSAQANLTLRVAASRLSAVLNELRDLGTVHSEKLSGEDVTEQIVDVDARLRNEERVEKELLTLLEQRNDAPLKEVLELRTNIANIRQTIERLVAQRDRLSRLVSLATVLVIIRPELEEPAKPEVKPEKSVLSHFSDAVSDSWTNGLILLADTLAGTVRVIVGGLLWWTILIVALLVLRQHLRRRAMAGC